MSLKLNEADRRAMTHKKDDFLKELDEKKFENAVLFLLLELYNTGVVEVSHRYSKMYIARPQFFIPMIAVVWNTAFNSLLTRPSWPA